MQLQRVTFQGGDIGKAFCQAYRDEFFPSYSQIPDDLLMMADLIDRLESSPVNGCAYVCTSHYELVFYNRDYENFSDTGEGSIIMGVRFARGGSPDVVISSDAAIRTRDMDKSTDLCQTSDMAVACEFITNHLSNIGTQSR